MAFLTIDKMRFCKNLKVSKSLRPDLKIYQNIVIISIADLKKAYTIAGTDVLNHSMLSSQTPCPVRTVWCVPWININVVRKESIHKLSFIGGPGGMGS